MGDRRPGKSRTIRDADSGDRGVFRGGGKTNPHHLRQRLKRLESSCLLRFTVCETSRRVRGGWRESSRCGGCDRSGRGTRTRKPLMRISRILVEPAGETRGTRSARTNVRRHFRLSEFPRDVAQTPSVRDGIGESGRVFQRIPGAPCGCRGEIRRIASNCYQGIFGMLGGGLRKGPPAAGLKVAAETREAAPLHDLVRVAEAKVRRIASGSETSSIAPSRHR